MNLFSSDGDWVLQTLLHSDGYGNSYGDGNGYGNGYGDGNGRGNGRGNGDGNGNGDGHDNGNSKFYLSIPPDACSHLSAYRLGVLG